MHPGLDTYLYVVFARLLSIDEQYIEKYLFYRY